MPRNNFIPAVIVLAAACISCSFLKGGSNNSPYGVGDIHKSTVPSVDPNAPFPAMSMDTINALITEVPEVGKHRDNVLDAERTAINDLLADIRDAMGSERFERALGAGANLELQEVVGFVQSQRIPEAATV